MIPNITKLTNEIARNIRESALLGALAVNAFHGYKEDDISENQAYRLYGKKWIDDRKERGQLHFQRVGATSKSAKYYSRFEIESLKRAEKYIRECVLPDLAGNVKEDKKQKKKAEYNAKTDTDSLGYILFFLD